MSPEECVTPNALELLHESQLVSIEIEESGHLHRRRTRIISRDNSTITVACLWIGDVSADAYIGADVSVEFAGEDALYSFESTVIGCTYSPLPTMILAKPTGISRIQRRIYPRICEQLPVRVTITDGACDRETAVSYLLETKDISAGGFKTAAPDRLHWGADVSVESLVLPDGAAVFGRGRVVHVQKAHQDDSDVWMCGIKFTRLDDQSREHLVRMTEACENRS